MAWQTPKTNWQSSDVVQPADMNRIEGNINSIENDSRTIDPTQAPSSNVGILSNFLNWFANRIKAITGKANWYDAPSKTLEDLNSHINNTNNPHHVTAAQIGVAPVPAGAVFWFAASSCPSGYLICDGSAVSRTTYATLFSVIGTTFGAGNGSTTFNLPDLRGVFIRGVDNGRGIDPSRSLGSLQQATYVKHVQDSGGAGYLQSASNTDPVVNSGTGERGGLVYGSSNNFSYTNSPVRPINVALLPCIKY